MRRVKLFVGLCIVGIGFVACAGSGEKARYVISESKAYEASLFRQNCAVCHGPEAEGKTLESGVTTPNLRQGEFKYKADAEIYRHIAVGGNGMVPFRGQLTEREIKLMVDFVQNELRARRNGGS